MKVKLTIIVDVSDDSDAEEVRKAIWELLDNTLDTGAMREISDLNYVALESVGLSSEI